MTRMPPRSASTIAAEGDVRADDHRVRLLLMTDTSVTAAGGSERFLRNLVSLLPGERYRITLVQLCDGDEADAGAALFDVGHVVLHKLPVGAVYGARGWRALHRLRRLARSERFDIVQSQHEKSDLLNALLPRSRRGARISSRRDTGFNKSPRLKLLFRFLNRRFDCVVAPAQPILTGLEHSERLDGGRALLIPNGVDSARFRPQADAARSQMRGKLGLHHDAIVFGCVAALTPVKRHIDVIAAFAIAQARLPGSRLLLIGDGPLRARIQAQIAELGLDEAVALLGDRPDIESILPALDLGLLASSTEGMSNAVLEMMACGLPVIATAVGGNPQLVAHQTTGLLVPACAPEALAAAMVALAESPDTRRSMAAAARDRVEREFSLHSMAQAFDQLYRRLLAHR